MSSTVPDWDAPLTQEQWNAVSWLFAGEDENRAAPIEGVA